MKNLTVMAKRGTARYSVDCDAYLVEKRYPRTYKDLMTWVHSKTDRYYTPFPVDPLFEEFDWGEEDDYANVMLIQLQERDGRNGLTMFEALLLWDVNVFETNSAGTTVNRLQV